MRRLSFGAAFWLLASPPALLAQEGSDRPVRLGEVTMPNSGVATAQAPFLLGLRLLHNFEYEDARRSFREARERDPAFALAYWGEALTFDHPLWGEEDRPAAQAALERLASTPEDRLAAAGTERERELLRSVHVLFGKGDKATRDSLYAAALGRLHAAKPDDAEIASLYALALLGTAEEGRDHVKYMRAAAVLEEAFGAHPRHPGVTHYMIHAYDDPVHAPLGLRAARVYADIAPDAVHALHMPSHIFFALGMWGEAVEANRRSWDASRARAARLGAGPEAWSFHALHWLHYAQLQLGDLEGAANSLGAAERAFRERPGPRTRWYATRMRAAQFLTDPAGQAALVGPLRQDAGEEPGARGAAAFAIGYAAFLRGDGTALRSAAEALDGAARERDATDLGIMRDQLAALRELAAGDDGAIGRLQEIAAREIAEPYEFGPPEVLKPTWEILGDVMRARGRPERASEYYGLSLRRNPNRALSRPGGGSGAAATGAAGLLRAASATGEEAP